MLFIVTAGGNHFGKKKLFKGFGQQGLLEGPEIGKMSAWG